MLIGVGHVCGGGPCPRYSATRSAWSCRVSLRLWFFDILWQRVVIYKYAPYLGWGLITVGNLNGCHKAISSHDVRRAW
jgi:hypothetical protein